MNAYAILIIPLKQLKTISGANREVDLAIAGFFQLKYYCFEEES